MRLYYMYTLKSILFIILFFRLYRTELAPRYRGGCTLINDTIYYVGGLVDSDKGEVARNEVYRLALSNGVKLNADGTANWELFTKLDNSDELVDVKVATYGTNGKLVIVGGDGPRFNSKSNIRVLDTKTKKWSLGTDVLDGTKVDKIENTNLSNVRLVNGTLINYSSDMLYVGGRIISDLLKEAQDLGLTSYSLEKKKVTFDRSTILPSKAAVTIHNNNLYIVGGQLNGTELKRMNEVLIYNFSTSTWSTNITNGNPPAPVINADTATYFGNLYFIGGTTSTTSIKNPPNTLYFLDLDSLTWFDEVIENFDMNYAGCLVYYNQHLIQSFGYLVGEKSAKTQLIDVRTKILVTEIPNYILPSEEDFSYKLSEFFKINKVPVIVVSVVLFIVICLLIIFCVLRRKRRIKLSDTSVYEDEDIPEPILETVWSDTFPRSDRNLSFSLNQESNIFKLETTQLGSYDSNITLIRTNESFK